MKTFPLLACLVFLAIHSNAQDPCIGNGIPAVFQANRIGALYYPAGSRFMDEDYEGAFRVPFTSSKSPGTIFSSQPWIGGLVDGQLKLAGPTFRQENKQDYYFGPLRPDGTPYGHCDEFNYIWQVTRGDIEKHRIDYAADGIIQDTIAAVFGWPAQGNQFFQLINGYDLPADHHGGWASFADHNQNGRYEPDLGEFPQAFLKDKPVNAEAIGWMVFHDQGPHTVSNGDPIGVEIQLTLFGFLCEENNVLNNTLFNTYKVINQNQQPLANTYFGIWSDYDLGCSEDDFLGSDSSLHTEFVYNDMNDGDVESECSTGVPTYGAFPPVQSMTYLSHPMHSFSANGRPFVNHQWPDITSPVGQYYLLQGLWADGTFIRNANDGYNEDSTAAITRFFFNGDPRDTAQWSWWQTGIRSFDVTPVSSVHIGELLPGAQFRVETAYTFHQDEALDHVQTVGLMYNNIDSLLVYVEDIASHCAPMPICFDDDCVWPGDFDHNGIADHVDMLYWGVMKEQPGPVRNGLINWAGHLAAEWDQVLPSGINAKHVDGNGNGFVNDEDVDRNLVHFLHTTPFYIPDNQYPVGPEIVISIHNGMSSDGRLRSLTIETGLPLNVLGISFEVEVDTNLYYIAQGLNAVICPADSNILCIGDNAYDPVYQDSFSLPRFMFVKTDHEELALEPEVQLHRLFNVILLRPGKTLADVPDTVEVRLKNLIAIDADGNDLHIGANVLRVPKYGLTATDNPEERPVSIYPNPVRDQLVISSTQHEAGMIYTVTGMPVMEFSAKEMENGISIGVLPGGMYYVKLSNSGSVGRFIKE